MIVTSPESSRQVSSRRPQCHRSPDFVVGDADPAGYTGGEGGADAGTVTLRENVWAQCDRFGLDLGVNGETSMKVYRIKKKKQ